MTNIDYLDSAGQIKFMKAEGLGTAADPQIVHHQDPSLLKALAWVTTPLSQATSAVYNSVNASQKVFTVPPNQEWQLVSAYFEMTTSATTGNRQILMQLENEAGGVLAQIVAGATQAASSLRKYSFGVGLADLTTFRDTDKLQTPLPPVILATGYRLRVSDSAGVDTVGDAIAVARLIVMQRAI